MDSPRALPKPRDRSHADEPRMAAQRHECAFSVDLRHHLVPRVINLSCALSWHPNVELLAKNLDCHYCMQEAACTVSFSECVIPRIDHWHRGAHDGMVCSEA
jgi:hypothetical protein